MERWSILRNASVNVEPTAAVTPPSTRTTDAEAKAPKIVADAETSAEQSQHAARSDAERDRESLRTEAIQEIKAVKEAIERLRDELDEELETQRILTRATRLNVVSSLVGSDATGVAGKAGGGSGSQPGKEPEGPE
jgi:polyphosphate kinase 2 (PPK2 family)